MRLVKRCVLAAVILLCAGATAHAGAIVRDPALIETTPIQGVTLAMTPKEAFDHLTAMG